MSLRTMLIHLSLAVLMALAPCAALAQADTVDSSPVVAEAMQKLSAAEEKIAGLSKRIEAEKDNDSALASLNIEVEALARSMLDIGVSLRPRLSELKARIDQLGAKPTADEEPEAPMVAEERARLAEERAAINALTGRAESVSVGASELGGQIIQIRRELFANTLLNRTSIDAEFFLSAVEAWSAEASDFRRTVRSWFNFVWSFKTNALLGAVFLSLMAALFFIAGGYRLFGRLIERDPAIADPSYISRLSVALWSTVIPTASVLALVLSIFGFLTNFAVLRGDISTMLSILLAVTVVEFFVGKLARSVLVPTMPNWRLVNMSNGGAQLMFWLVLAMAIVNGADYVLGGISEALGSPVVLTVAKSFVAAIIIGLILIVMSRSRPMLAESGDPKDPGRPWPRLISAALMLAGLGLVLMALTGYVGLARFAATQIVVTGAILATMYIGYLSAQAVSGPSAFAETTIGRFIDRRFAPGQVTLDQTGIAAGLLINLAVLLIGVPLILLQWGFQIQDIQIWLYRVLTDIRVGGITISLMGILIGVLLFLFGLFATRWFQRWLDGSVMARGRVDTGVRNSIKTGIGYLGVGLAGLLAISAAGIDLSSLALVAGALSLGIGFGLQNIVSNFVSGLILLVERPFKVGDWVVTGATEGFVKKISVRATEIETFNRQSIIVPNADLINASVGNWTHRNRMGRADVNVGVGYGSDPRQVMTILEEIALAHPKVLRNPEPIVQFIEFGASSIDFALKVFIADILDGGQVRSELRLAIFERLKAEGIEIPYPQRDFNITAVSAENLARAFSAGRSPTPEPQAGFVLPDDRPVGAGDGEAAAVTRVKAVSKRKPARA
ncbi:small-conductance mechanosensitive channel [Hoeflea marina]|uniref:Small-conductance mechanosensitive channel n=1 Tax=Hoeflea marina TaxID=274592 RepID=A0A317PG50_9HYPH|nr:mechanosensitive ion channel family protein [Hoeflea marina]PWV99025.1 small-conductance mechanosensitive channel [Hoeflea marina]